MTTTTEKTLPTTRWHNLFRHPEYPYSDTRKGSLPTIGRTETRIERKNNIRALFDILEHETWKRKAPSSGEFRLRGEVNGNLVLGTDYTDYMDFLKKSLVSVILSEAKNLLHTGDASLRSA